MKHSVILIMTDQQRADTLHYINPDSPCITPNLDALASDSVCFTNAYTNAPVCTPARAALQTGYYPSRTGMCTNIYQHGCDTHEIADEPYLLSRRLNDSGYICGFTGKWHLGLGKDKTASAEGRQLLKRCENGYMAANAYLHYGTLPTDVGYVGDDFPGHGTGGHKTPQFLQWLEEHNREYALEEQYGGNRPGDHSHGALVTSGESSTVEHFLAERTNAIVDEISRKGPFFMCTNFWGPHEPYNTLQEDYALYRDMRIPPWASFTETKEVQNKMHRLVQRPEMDWSFFENNLKHYYGLITGIDRSIGMIIRHLKEKNLYDDSFIIFCADHGDSQGCHNGMENKAGHMYEEITHIPLMIKPPKGTTMQLRDGFATTVDLYATILDIAGYPEEYFHSGHSLLPMLTDPCVKVRDYAVCECVSAFALIGTQRMLRKDCWKYVFNCGGEDELYDLSKDPEEMYNLINETECRETVHRLREELARAMYHHNDDTAIWFCKMNHIMQWSMEGDTNEKI